MLPRHVSLVLPLSLLWLCCQFCFLSYVLWPELGGLGSRESCSFSCCLDSLSVATTLQTHCTGLQLGSAKGCHLFSCRFSSVALSLATCCDPAVACGMRLSHTLGWHLLLALGQDWALSSCQCSWPLGFVPVLCHLRLMEAWLMGALGD